MIIQSIPDKKSEKVSPLPVITYSVPTNCLIYMCVLTFS
jgi:hypothetical protein